eukprot:178522_1
MADVDDGPRDIGNDATAITFGATTVPIANDPSPQQQPAPSAPEQNMKAQEVELQAIARSASDYYFKVEVGGKMVAFKLHTLSEAPPDGVDLSTNLLSTATATAGEGLTRQKTVEEIEEEMNKEMIGNLVPDSTNGWLYIKDTYVSEDGNGAEGCLANCTDNAANKFIAVFVLVIQIASYIAMTAFLASSRRDEAQAMKETCYGPHCEDPTALCMSFDTGGLTSILLVGFIWADVVNTLSLMFKCNKDPRWFIASIFVLVELLTAIVCGFLVGVYSETEFDAIGGAVGILFVHDLDEKVYASMEVFRETGYATLKKITAVGLWVILSLIVALFLSCRYENDALFGVCLQEEFSCVTGSQCVWQGFVCNGVSDCDDGSDEFDGDGHPICDYLKIVCPGSDASTYAVDCDTEEDTDCHPEEPSHFMCESDGSCIPFAKRCDGVVDCDDGSDEGRAQNCQLVISKIECSNQLNITTLSDEYSQKWSGYFKCTNGQCIDAQYACDGVPGDCVDGSDEYPDFSKARESPWLVACPYAKLVECADDEVLCKVDGRCITKSAVCDGIKNCPDGADERHCKYQCEDQVKAAKQFQCGGNIAGINDSHVITWRDADDNTVNTTNADNFTLAIDDMTPANWTALFANSRGECVPMKWRCDGTSDCDDNTDEELCSLFSCADGEYQCTDTGACIPMSWLCDSISDCTNEEDEDRLICSANGVNPTSNKCVDDGYAYQCSTCKSCCLYEWDMCDGYADCPAEDDEDEETCLAVKNAASTTTTTLAAGGNGPMTCGQSHYGSGAIGSYTFTTPAVGGFMMSVCNAGTAGEGWMTLCQTGDPSVCANVMLDTLCACDWRPVVFALVGDEASLPNIFPTSDPTEAPTPAPTKVPTPQPTSNPTTATPTNAPTTADPTSGPTTANPTAVPSVPTDNPTTTAPTLTPTPAPTPCDEYVCVSDFSCLNYQQLCDGIDDCGEDEITTVCDNACSYYNFYQCSDTHQCIRPSMMCDSTNDCSDGGDENTTNCDMFTTTPAPSARRRLQSSGSSAFDGSVPVEFAVAPNTEYTLTFQSYYFGDYQIDLQCYDSFQETLDEFGSSNSCTP